MIHHVFSHEEAINYGLAEAILLDHIRKHVMYNTCSHDVNDDVTYLQDKRYWMVSTIAQFKSHLPFLGEREIKRGLMNLVKVGAILRGNYNEHPMERTWWYTDQINPHANNKKTRQK